MNESKRIGHIDWDQVSPSVPLPFRVSLYSLAVLNLDERTCHACGKTIGAQRKCQTCNSFQPEETHENYA